MYDTFFKSEVSFGSINVEFPADLEGFGFDVVVIDNHCWLGSSCRGSSSSCRCRGSSTVKHLILAASNFGDFRRLLYWCSLILPVSKYNAP